MNDLYRALLTEAQASVERIAAPIGEEFASQARKNEAQCALALVQAAVTLTKAAGDRVRGGR